MGRTSSPSLAVAKVTCSTPTPGKAPVRIEAWKYDCVRRALLAALPRGGEGLRFADLPGIVRRALTARELRELGSVTWYVTTVKLDLEVRGSIRRIPGSPQRLVRAS